MKHEGKNLWTKLIYTIFLQWRINGVMSDICSLNKIVEIIKSPIDDHSTPKHEGCYNSSSFLSRLREHHMIQDLLELKRIRAALLNDGSMNIAQLAWSRYSHEGYEVLPNILAAHTAALYWRHNTFFFPHSKKMWLPELASFFFSSQHHVFLFY